MDSLTSPPPCPSTVSVRRNPPRRAKQTPMRDPTPIQIEALLPLTLPDPPLYTVAAHAPPSESLKIFLRIKPIVRASAAAAASKQLGEAVRSRTKNAWPQNPTVSRNNSAKEKQPAKKKSGSEICISVTDSSSVTISPPPSLVDSKKIKSEVYEGFSHVFAPDSLQSEVYERMVKPMVEEFLQGRNGMLAALGPSGSGKTHTVFGTPREPGMVPRALQHIFKQSKGSDCKFSRSFYLSIFEIYSERGKGEKICDLIPERVESGLQPTTKGVQEVLVSNASEAESLIACAMLKRATSMTNTNSQSSRSQCIINVHMKHSEVRNQPDDAVLTIVDLAGAEREKRTGNQGAKLLESNFINNTSMVFGLCLRALLEHQKNPKKPLQKHFQNSLLTKYLREYLEGKKRMSLILTVKPGEEDYLDTASLLRQASPYMKIKFNNVEDPSGPVCNKRPLQSFSRIGQQKRMKPGGVDAQTEEPKISGDENLLLQETHTNEASIMDKQDSACSSSLKLSSTESFTIDRSHIIMQNFAKAIWNVLKQFKQKLVVVEREVESVGEELRNEKARRIELEKELEDLKLRCTCSKENTEEATSINFDETECVLEPKPCDSPKSTASVSEEICSVLEPKPCDSPKSTESLSEQICAVSEPKACDSPNSNESISEQTQQDIDVLAQTNAAISSPQGASQSSSKHQESGTNELHDHGVREDRMPTTSIDLRDDKTECLDLNLKLVNTQPVVVLDENPLELYPSPTCLEANQEETSNLATYVPEDAEDAECLDLKQKFVNTQPMVVPGEDPLELHPSPTYSEANHAETSNLATSAPEDAEVDDTVGLDFDRHKPCQAKPGPSDPTPSPFKVQQDSSLEEPKAELGSVNRGKLTKPEKPKRRLLPASSSLLRDITALAIDDELDKPKGIRGGKKLTVDETKKTQGSISLLRLLQSHLRL